MTAISAGPIVNSLTTGKLPKGSVWLILVASWVLMGLVFVFVQLAGGTKTFNIVGAIFLGTILFDILIWVLSRLVEGARKAKDRLITSLISTAFVVTLLPLVSLLYTVVSKGFVRMIEPSFFSESMRNILGSDGGIVHAIIGTLEITLSATIISVPIGLLTAVYLVEYGRGPLARTITFLVDVMTGIPSIVAGLFAFALFVLITGNPGYRTGFSGSVALAVLMIPIVVRSSEEMLKLVPNELREASFALGVPKWLTVLKVVFPTSIAGIVTGITLAIARVIGETAPLLVAAGFTASVNYDPFNHPMMTMPVFAYTQYMQQGAIQSDYVNRAWATALTLILIVMVLNIVARLVARIFAPKLGRR